MLADQLGGEEGEEEEEEEEEGGAFWELCGVASAMFLVCIPLISVVVSMTMKTTSRSVPDEEHVRTCVQTDDYTQK